MGRATPRSKWRILLKEGLVERTKDESKFVEFLSKELPNDWTKPEIRNLSPLTPTDPNNYARNPYTLCHQTGHYHDGSRRRPSPCPTPHPFRPNFGGVLSNSPRKSFITDSWTTLRPYVTPWSVRGSVSEVRSLVSQ